MAINAPLRFRVASVWVLALHGDSCSGLTYASFLEVPALKHLQDARSLSLPSPRGGLLCLLSTKITKDIIYELACVMW